jgi:ribosomal protein L31E
MERTYTIPLRKEFQKVPTYKKSKKAMKAIKEFMVRHMHAANFEAVKVLNELNNEVWMHGIRNPPPKIKVTCKKLENGNVLVQLFGQPFPEAKKEEKKQGMASKVAEKITGKAPMKGPESKQTEKKTQTPKPEVKAAPAGTHSHKPNQEQKRSS